jgi:cysteine desulfurase
VTSSAYLDHAATTPLRRAAAEAVAEELSRVGNPSALHSAGRAARAVVEEARESLAASLGAHPSEVVLTSGGTEADNLAVLGTHRARVAVDPRRRRVVASSFEHHAVLEPAEHLVEREGAEVTWVDPGPDGIVTAESVRAAIEEDPASVSVVSVMWANNELGTISPLPAIAAIAHAHGIPVHSDAVQAFGHVPLDVATAGVDLLTVTAHKLGGPVGVGALVARRDALLEPIAYGGGQERDVRSGTLNVAGARGFAVAAAEAVGLMAEESARITSLRDELMRRAVALDPTIEVTGAWTPGDTSHRLPGHAHLLVPDTDSEALLYVLDRAGVAASTGSACRAGVARQSHVVGAIGRGDFVGTALRLTLGHPSTAADVEAFLAVLPEAVAAGRRAMAVA